MNVADRGRTDGMHSRTRKIDEDDVRAIRADDRSYAAIARTWGLAEQHIRRIKLRLAWRDVK